MSTVCTQQNEKPMAEHCAKMLRALADETRLAVVCQLLDRQKTVSEIRDELDIEQSLLSHHLKILRQADVVVGQRVGKHIRYRLVQKIAWQGQSLGIDLGCCQLAFNPKNIHAVTESNSVSLSDTASP